MRGPLRRRANTAFLFGVTAVALYLCYRIAQPFLTAIFAAIVLAIVFYTMHARIKRWVAGPNWAATLSTIAVILIVIVPAIVLGIVMTRQLGDLYQSLSQQGAAEGGVRAYLMKAAQGPLSVAGKYIDLSAVDLRSTLLGWVERVRQYLIEIGVSAAKNLPALLLKTVVVFFTLFFFFRDGPHIKRRTVALLPLTHEQSAKLTKGISDTIVASVHGSIAVGLAQGILTGLAFWILGVPSPIVAAALAAIASLIPVVGTGLVWVPGALLLFLWGHGVKALILLALGSAVIAQVDVLIRPYVVSESAKLNGLLIFFALLGGINAFGIMGVIIGPVVVSITIAVLNMLKDENALSPERELEDPAMTASDSKP